MNFDLKRPCKDCPFRTDVADYLSRGRRRQIANSLIRQQATFSGHKLNEFVEDDDGNSVTVEGAKAQHCAGALIFLEAQNLPNQMMRIAERLGMYDRSKLDMEAPVHRTTASFVATRPVTQESPDVR